MEKSVRLKDRFIVNIFSKFLVATPYAYKDADEIQLE